MESTSAYKLDVVCGMHSWDSPDTYEFSGKSGYRVASDNVGAVTSVIHGRYKRGDYGDTCALFYDVRTIIYG